MDLKFFWRCWVAIMTLLSFKFIIGATDMVTVVSGIWEIKREYFSSSKQVTLMSHTLNDIPSRVITDAPQVIVSVQSHYHRPKMNHLETDLFILFINTRLFMLPSVLSAVPKKAQLNILVVLSEPDRRSLDSSVKILSSSQFVNSVIIQENNSEIMAFGFSPYSESSCMGIDTVPFLLDTWNSSSGWSRKTRLFPRNLGLNLHGCSLRCVVVNTPYTLIIEETELEEEDVRVSGLGIDLIDILASKLNFSCRYSLPIERSLTSVGNLSGPSTLFGAVPDIILGNGDIGIGNYLMAADRIKVVDVITPTEHCCVTWAVPSGYGSKYDQYDKVFRELSSNVWFGLILVVVISFLFIVVIGHIQGHRYDTWLLIIHLSSSIIGLQVEHQYLSKWWERLFLTSWFLMSIVISSAYIASLRHCLLRNIDTEIRTIDDLISSPLYVYAPGIFHDILTATANDDSKIKKLIPRYDPAAKRLEEGVNSVLMQGTHGVLGDASAMSYYLKLHEDNMATTTSGHIFDKCFGNIPVGPVLFRKGSMLKYDFDRLALRLNDAGVLSYLRQWYRARQKEKRRYNRLAIALSMDNLKSVFVFLYLGQAVAAVIFIIELCIWFLSRICQMNVG